MARKILLADDSVTAQNMGRKILSDAGYEVITVNNGSAALKKIIEQKPDLVVLDVYMPGYSGLEVCQRIKDTRETSRIPILLTVGKLEPFKPEEARKAKADAYIVKPFEASELLVALTRLEDKIVPQAESYKPGRFAKAIAAVERFNNAEPEESFGDKDSGWKNRIKFPSRGSKPAEPEPEEVTGKKALHDEEKPVEPNRAFERPIPEGLPKDITPEEIEAITAAAAQFNEHGKAASDEHATRETETHDQNGSEAASSEPVTAAISSQQDRSEATSESALPGDVEIPEPQREEAPPVTFAGTADAPSQSEQMPQASPSAPETEVPVETASSEDRASVVEASQDRGSGNNEDHYEAPAHVAEMPFAPPESIAASVPAASVPAESIPAEPDADVTAALQNLSPANGNRGTAQPSGAGDTQGPRWVAEPVSLDTHEATLALEKEMHKAFAAFAAADDAKATFVTIAPEASPTSSINRPWNASPAAQDQPSSPPEAASYANSDSEEALAKNASDTVPAPVEASAEPAPPSAAGWSDSPTSVHGAEPAESQMVTDSSSPDHPAAHSEVESAPKENSRETAQKAAAWENWQQLRGAVGGSTPELADVAAAALANSSQDQSSTKPEAMAAAAGAGNNTASGSEGDSTAIASIVDSVLAELKPKLMEEIARKMKKDSKQE